MENCTYLRKNPGYAPDDGLLMSKEDIVFPKSDRQPLFEAMVCVDNKLLYATKKSVGDQREVVQLILQSDGVRLECIEEHVILSILMLFMLQTNPQIN